MAHRPIIVTGAEVLCYVNANLIGRVTSFTMNSVTGYRSARGVDIDTVQEEIPTTVEVTFALGLLRTHGDGGAQGAGLAPTQDVVSRFKYYTILLVDRKTDTPIFKADNCVTPSESWTLDAKGRMVGNVSCKGITWQNEFSST